MFENDYIFQGKTNTGSFFPTDTALSNINLSFLRLDQQSVTFARLYRAVLKLHLMFYQDTPAIF